MGRTLGARVRSRSSAIFDLVAESADELTIGEVAQETGLSVHALRFYEREGLTLTPRVARGTGGHRRYSPQEVAWLRICIKLRRSGMPLAKIRHYAELVKLSRAEAKMTDSHSVEEAKVRHSHKTSKRRA